MKRNAMKKVMRDLLQETRRSFTVLLAIVLGIFAVAMLSSSKSLLNKNLSENYLRTNPASFTMILDSLDDNLRNKLLNLDYIENVELRPSMLARLTLGKDEHVPVILFPVEDFRDLRINTFNLDRGNFPQSKSEFVIEREGLKLTDLTVGNTYQLQVPGAGNLHLRLSGFSHDPGVAPSWMEGRLYAYVPRTSFPKAFFESQKAEVKLTVSENKYDVAYISQKVEETIRLLEAGGVRVYRTEVPTPGVHMHQRQMDALMFLVLLFGILTLFLSSFLVINMISAIMAREVRQIALMKATGASSAQITSIYLLSLGIMSLVALAIGTPLGLMAGHAFAGFNADMLNFILYDTSTSWEVILFILTIGLLLPLFLSFVPVYNASRVSIQASLNHTGIEESTTSINGLIKRLGAFLSLSGSLVFALRNSFRRKSRLILTLVSLSLGGAIFITSFNLRQSTNSAIDNNFDNQAQDVMIMLERPVRRADIDLAVANVAQLSDYETGQTIRGGFIKENGLDSKSFDIRSMPADARLYQPELTAGKWFDSNKAQIVINRVMQSEYPDLKIGEQIDLKIDGKTRTYEITGICNQLFAPSGIFMENSQLNRHLELEESSGNLILVDIKEGLSVEESVLAVESALKKSGIAVVNSTPKSVYKKLVVDHLVIIMMMLLAMTFLVILVGCLGMITSFGINISERKREIGILQSIGIDKMSLTKIILSEGIVVGVLSWLMAIVLSFPISLYLGNEFFHLFFESNLELEFSPTGIGIWFILVTVIGGVASYLPARRAYNMNTVEALNYE